MIQVYEITYTQPHREKYQPRSEFRNGRLIKRNIKDPIIAMYCRRVFA